MTNDKNLQKQTLTRTQLSTITVTSAVVSAAFTVATQPIDTIKVFRQARGDTFRGYIRDLPKSPPYRGLYNGGGRNGSRGFLEKFWQTTAPSKKNTAIRELYTGGARNSSRVFLEKSWQTTSVIVFPHGIAQILTGERKPTTDHYVLSSVPTALVDTTLSHPWDVAKVRKQTGSSSLYQEFVESGGIKKLPNGNFITNVAYAGAGAGLAKSIIGWGLYYTFYPKGKKANKDNNENISVVRSNENISVVRSILRSSLGYAATKVLFTQPFENIRVQMQINKGLSNIEAYKNIRKTRGLSGFYYGATHKGALGVLIAATGYAFMKVADQYRTPTDSDDSPDFLPTILESSRFAAVKCSRTEAACLFPN